MPVTDRKGNTDKMKRLRWLAIAAFSVTAGAHLMAGAAPANADDGEQEFVNALVHHGGLPGTEATWLQEGHAVCDGLASDTASGVSPQKSGFNSIQMSRQRGWDAGDAVVIVSAAVSYLCPQTHSTWRTISS